MFCGGSSLFGSSWSELTSSKMCARQDDIVQDAALTLSSKDHNSTMNTVKQRSQFDDVNKDVTWIEPISVSHTVELEPAKHVQWLHVVSFTLWTYSYAAILIYPSQIFCSLKALVRTQQVAGGHRGFGTIPLGGSCNAAGNKPLCFAKPGRVFSARESTLHQITRPKPFRAPAQCGSKLGTGARTVKI
eukprot:6467859-Amphidinium_carterae.1